MTAQTQPDTIRVATVQYGLRGLSGPDAFERQVDYFVTSAADYGCDFILFPELFPMQLLSSGERLPAAEAMAAIDAATPRFAAFMARLAQQHRLNIVAGSHPVRIASGATRNRCHVFLRDGTAHHRDKLHPTPSEREAWGIEGGTARDADVIPTDCGPIGIMICYDSEFPELPRRLVDQGAEILFVPYCTDDRRGHLRVRYCCAARAVENQCYVVTAGVTGNLPNVFNMDIHHAESAILTPSDMPFARDGIAAEVTPNTEGMAVADLSMTDLRRARASGAVRNLADRRLDLYRVDWID
ncbi:MAG: carbon-nitrogen hydrolase family protein [Sphingopyxis sp.]|uniref:carbon-nitrogen hydrolase family protein n=1 Tax=Sphingopyxis sp. TaxID=1908224 RepID=UPI001A3C5DF6|nr:carbon-nitrogen hydrolase family protein [Sphingopyxis sp.]MBL9069853.1 carbon-nitrogen hydrolase family protein [Sphingopyxis sp.]